MASGSRVLGRLIAGGLGALVLIGAALLALLFVEFGSDPLGLGDGGGGHFPNVLDWASPDPWRGNTYRGVAWATAAELNRIHQGHELSPRIHYVNADQPSPNHFVASVNPIDNYTWSAVARSSDGRCYAILTINDRTMPEYGDTRYGIIPKSLPCEARYATRDTVRREEAPN